ncbi:MAG TPA: WbuC family cupin fold metalloprotein, partial [Bacilli bacterium]|nr:WbuC family cupin fold metalloprotein [Bacilli bacterium]
ILVKYYDDKGNLTEETELNVKKGKFGIDIPAGQFHTLEVLESGTVIFEVKEGPYRPIGEDDMLKSGI